MSFKVRLCELADVCGLVALLHGAGEEYRDLLDRLRGLPTTAETKVSGFMNPIRSMQHS